MKLKNNFLIRVLLLCSATLLICMPVSFSAPAASATAQAQVVQSLEDTLFAVRYEQEPLEQRIGRLEETVFGQKQTGPLDTRVTKLKSALSPAALGPLSPVATKDKVNDGKGATESANKAQPKKLNTKKAVNPATLPKPSTAQPNTAKADNIAAAPSPGETDYPTVSQMEQKIFNKTYVNEDITVRLTRLEKDVFKVPQSGALADRVDNLRMVVLGDIGNGPPAIASYPMSNGGYIPAPGPGQSYTPPQYAQGTSYTPPPAQYGNNGGYNQGYSNGGYPGTQVSSAGQPYYGQPVPGNYQPNAYSGGGDYQASYQPGMNPAPMANGQVSPDMLAAMDEVEKQVIGHTYPSEPVPTRLDRLENKVFHTTSPELPAQERMQRVIAVASAGGAPSSPQAKAKSTFQTLLPIILTILPLILL
jgi:hypothetical protein